jgi:hypothetical protein
VAVVEQEAVSTGRKQQQQVPKGFSKVEAEQQQEEPMEVDGASGKPKGEGQRSAKRQRVDAKQQQEVATAAGRLPAGQGEGVIGGGSLQRQKRASSGSVDVLDAFLDAEVGVDEAAMADELLGAVGQAVKGPGALGKPMGSSSVRLQGLSRGSIGSTRDAAAAASEAVGAAGSGTSGAGRGRAKRAGAAGVSKAAAAAAEGFGDGEAGDEVGDEGPPGDALPLKQATELAGRIQEVLAVSRDGEVGNYKIAAVLRCGVLTGEPGGGVSEVGRSTVGGQLQAGGAGEASGQFGFMGVASATTFYRRGGFWRLSQSLMDWCLAPLVLDLCMHVLLTLPGVQYSGLAWHGTQESTLCGVLYHYADTIRQCVEVDLMCNSLLPMIAGPVYICLIIQNHALWNMSSGTCGPTLV